MTTYKIDKDHSEITFKVKHLMISTVSGIFKDFTANMETPNGELENGKISFEADVNSIDTRSEQRDAHLKSDDFFNAEIYPTLSFASNSFLKTSGDDYVLTGDMTIRDVTKPVKLQVEYTGSMTDPYGQEKLGFEINGKINRKDFGLKWNAVTEAGGVVVSDDVKLHLQVQMIKN
jgi:polyisoprenoid-binding protein YceI